MAGIIFAKFTVPRARGETIIFSKNAVVTMRNGELFILCRISDLRKYSLLEAHVRMIIIRKEKTDEGEIIPYQQTDLECGSEVRTSKSAAKIEKAGTLKLPLFFLFHRLTAATTAC